MLQASMIYTRVFEDPTSKGLQIKLNNFFNNTYENLEEDQKADFADRHTGFVDIKYSHNEHVFSALLVLKYVEDVVDFDEIT